MRPCGGLLGGALAVEVGNEHQGHGTPHGHGQVHVVNLYQLATMKDIAAKLEEGQVQTRDMESFQDWFHVERALEPEAHAAYEQRAEEEYFARLNAPEHLPLSQIPPYLQEDLHSGQHTSLSQCTYANPSSMAALERWRKTGRDFYAGILGMLSLCSVVCSTLFTIRAMTASTSL